MLTLNTTLTLIAAYLGLFVGLIDANAINLALPAVRDDLGGGVAGAQWAAAFNACFADASKRSTRAAMAARKDAGTCTSVESFSQTYPPGIP